MKKSIVIFLLTLSIVSASLVLAADIGVKNLLLDSNSESNMPPAIQKIIDYNNSSTADFAVKISFLIAFIAGMLSILSPCILPFLPAYFSYTFKEKKNITKMTLVFFSGFSIVFIAMGVIAGYIGSQVLTVIQGDFLVTLAGSFIVIFGLMSLLGKGFSSFIRPNRRFKNDIVGTFLFGIFFAVGWTACLGPILAGILGIGAILNNIWYSAILLFFYSLGNLVPLFILSVFYDKYNLSNSRLIRGKMFNFNLFGKKIEVHSTNLLSGIIFIFLGIIMIIYKGTSIFNRYDFLGTKSLFYSVQDKLIAWPYANYLGVILFLLFIFFIGRVILKRNSLNIKEKL